MVAEIDVAPLEELIEIGREQARLDEFRRKAEELRASVNEAVFSRVMEDYADRHAALDRQAAPIKAQVRRAYRKLRETLSRAHATEEEARLAAEELELRHAVGELDETELAERRQDPDRVVERCRSQLATLDALKAHFIEAFGSEAELEIDPGLVSAVPAAQADWSRDTATSSRASSISGSRAAASMGTVSIEMGSMGNQPTVVSGLPDSEDTTNIFSVPAGERPEETPDGENGRQTLSVPPALLDPEDGSAPHPLALSNYIGRSEENHIRLVKASVSRQHALVAATSGGFVIQDLHSQNGTFVNGARVSRHTLQDGDHVKIGDVAFVFRVSRAAPAASATQDDGGMTN
jgi:FHA domain